MLTTTLRPHQFGVNSWVSEIVMMPIQGAENLYVFKRKFEAVHFFSTPKIDFLTSFLLAFELWVLALEPNCYSRKPIHQSYVSP